jgi:putative transposase
VPQGLKRFQQSGQSHFITFSCYHRRPELTNPEVCRGFFETLETARKCFAIRIYGYVLMPEHVHLLLSEPASGTLAEALHFVKLSSAKQLRSDASHDDKAPALWQTRYYDRNIRDSQEFAEWTAKNREISQIENKSRCEGNGTGAPGSRP